MGGFQSIEGTLIALAALVPGIIIVYVRSQFTTGRQPPLAQFLVVYVVLSLVYYAVTLPLFVWILELEFVGWAFYASWMSLVLILPGFIGAMLGLSAHYSWTRKMLSWLGLNVVHPAPTAWDWWFGLPHPRWIIVTLKDGTVFGGYFGAASFASSDPVERDLFIEQIYDIDEENRWNVVGEKGLLIANSQIQSLEFLPIEKQ